MTPPLAHDPDFFDRFAQLLDLERAADRARTAELKATLSLAEQEARGLVLLDLEPVEESVGLGGRFLITLEHAEKRRLSAQLHPGDLVALRPRKAEIDHPPSALVTRATRHRVQVAFDRAPPPFIGEGRLRLDIVPNDVTYDRAKGALTRLKGLDRGAARRLRDVLLGAAAPRFERPIDFEPSRPLNPEQHEAVALALSAEDFFLVHGPPGTGKSTVLAEVAVQAARGGQRLLCTAASNAAVDHLLELCLGAGLRALRVGHPARVLPHLQQHTLDLLVEDHPDRKLARELFSEAFELMGYARRQRSQGRSRQRFANARESSAEAKKLLDDARALERKAVKSVLANAQVLCATCAQLEGGLLLGEEFDLALLDEATQAIEPIALIAFLKAPKVILAGDHRQLAPTVLSKEAAERGLKKSLFERLLEEHGEAVKRMLREQYRMNEQIMSFPSREMYGGELRAHPSVAGRTLREVLSSARTVEREVDAPPILFLDTAGKGFEDAAALGSESRFNEGEAQLVAARARELVAAGLDPKELAVIAPYSAQVALVREKIPALEIEIDTVDAFQGREKDAVLLSLTRSNAEGALGFLTDLRRMNVALTRARRHLFVVGDSATLASHPFYARFMEAAQEGGGYRSVWEWPEPEP